MADKWKAFAHDISAAVDDLMKPPFAEGGPEAPMVSLDPEGEPMFVFGQAPAGFAQVETPHLYCTAVGSLPSGSFTNVADAGGVYNGQWVQAVSRWVTTVYGKPEPLPRTGY